MFPDTASAFLPRRRKSNASILTSLEEHVEVARVDAAGDDEPIWIEIGIEH